MLVEGVRRDLAILGCAVDDALAAGVTLVGLELIAGLSSGALSLFAAALASRGIGEAGPGDARARAFPGLVGAADFAAVANVSDDAAAATGVETDGVAAARRGVLRVISMRCDV
jgi:hypothetical protein